MINVSYKNCAYNFSTIKKVNKIKNKTQPRRVRFGYVNAVH